MNKYWVLFGLSWQRQLEVRSDFLFERSRSLSVLFSLYFLWSALLSSRNGIMGYNREQMLTYVFMMTLLRAWVLSCVTDRIPSEIARGKISEVLLRPISYLSYWASQDAACKSLNIASAAIELLIFTSLVSAPFLVPSSLVTWMAFVAVTVGGMILYFQMSYMLGVLGFWTSQSWGPRFFFEVVLEFCAGAYFPIDLLPSSVQRVLNWLPFPYLIHYPLAVYLERLTGSAVVACLIKQGMWMVLLGLLCHFFWKKGLAKYAAEGG